MESSGDSPLSEPPPLAVIANDTPGRVAGTNTNLASSSSLYNRILAPAQYVVDLWQDRTYFKVKDHSHDIFRIDYDKNVIIHEGANLHLLGTLEDANGSRGDGDEVLTAQGGGLPPVWKSQQELSAGDLACDDCLDTGHIKDVYLLNTGDTATGTLVLDPSNDSHALVVKADASQSVNILDIRNSSNGNLLSVSSSGDLIVGSGTFDNPSASGDIYTAGNLEVDGAIYGAVVGTITPNFTQGSIAFANASGALTENNSNLFWDDTNNRLGIGTSSPSQALVVDGNTYLAGTLNTSGAITAGGDISLGVNTLSGTTATIDFSNFDVDSSGNITATGNLSVDGTALYDGTVTAPNFDVSSATSGSYKIDGVTYMKTGNGTGFQSSLYIGPNSGANINDSITNNVAVGWETLNDATTGRTNTAVGSRALDALTVSIGNVAIGSGALGSFNGGINDANTAIGINAGTALTTLGDNVFIGNNAGDNITSGSRNIIIGGGIDAVTTSQSNTLNIGNIIFANNMDGTGTTISTGNVGIGTTSPTYKLHTAGNIYSSQDILALGTIQAQGSLETSGNITASGNLSVDGTSLFGGNIATQGNWISGDGDAEGISINNSGNVGIGTSGPGAKLEIYGDTLFNYSDAGINNVKDVLTITRSSTNYSNIVAGFGSKIKFKNSWAYDGALTTAGSIAMEASSNSGRTGYDMVLSAKGAGYAADDVNVMRLRSDGPTYYSYVSIGTDNITTPFSVYHSYRKSGGIRFHGNTHTATYGTDAYNTGLQLIHTSDEDLATNGFGTGVDFYLQRNGAEGKWSSGYIRSLVSATSSSYVQADLSFGTNGGNSASSERMRITDTGNVGIGDTSPSHLLSVGNGDKFTVSSTGQADAGTNGDGLVTKVNAGACDDSVFTTDTNGLLCVDSSNGRIYFRYGDAWHYAAETAGFQIPEYETEGLEPGDLVVGRLDKTLPDGGLHGIWEQLTPAMLVGLGNESLDTTELNGLLVKEALTVHGNAHFLGDVEVEGDLSRGNEKVGRAIIPEGGNEVRIEFEEPFESEPVVQVTVAQRVGEFWTQDRTPEGFVIRTADPVTEDTIFDWTALLYEEIEETRGTIPGEEAASTPTTANDSPEESPETLSEDRPAPEISANEEESDPTGEVLGTDSTESKPTTAPSPTPTPSPSPQPSTSPKPSPTPTPSPSTTPTLQPPPSP